MVVGCWWFFFFVTSPDAAAAAWKRAQKRERKRPKKKNCHTIFVCPDHTFLARSPPTWIVNKSIAVIMTFYIYQQMQRSLKVAWLQNNFCCVLLPRRGCCRGPHWLLVLVTILPLHKEHYSRWNATRSHMICYLYHWQQPKSPLHRTSLKIGLSSYYYVIM